MDLLPLLLHELTSARAAGLAGQIVTRCESMDALALPDASFDLVWSEGALYSVGFANGLRALRRLLRPGGAWPRRTQLAGGSRPEPARAFWREAYPALATRAANRAALVDAGYERGFRLRAAGVGLVERLLRRARVAHRGAARAPRR